jgi:hypothetical protein
LIAAGTSLATVASPPAEPELALAAAVLVAPAEELAGAADDDDDDDELLLPHPTTAAAHTSGSPADTHVLRKLITSS